MNITNVSQWCQGSYCSFNRSLDEDTVMFYHILWSIVTPVLFTAIIIVGTTGNLLVIYVIWSRITMQTATNYLLINLAVSDVAFLLFCVPITAYKFASYTYPFGDVMCKIISYVMYVTAYVTVYTLVAVSFLRYFTVVHSARTAKFRTKRNVLWCNLSIWSLIILVTIPCLFTHKLKKFDDNITYCGLAESSIKPLFTTFFVFSYTLPLGVIFVIYLNIVNHLRVTSVSAVGQARQRTARASRVIALVVIAFALFWLPFHVNQMLAAFDKVPHGKLYEVFRVIASCLAYANSCANPIIYNFVSTEFRRGFRDVVWCKKPTVVHRNGTRHTGVALLTDRTAIV